MVSSSVTSNDGGVGVLQDEITNFVPFQYLNTEGLRAPKFGERVRIAVGSITNDFTTEEPAAAIVVGSKVQVADDYGAYRLTSKSGKRLLVTGDNILFEDGYGTGGEADAVYRYLGPNGRVDLGAEDFSDDLRWAKLGGETGAIYQYQGADPARSTCGRSTTPPPTGSRSAASRARSTSGWARTSTRSSGSTSRRRTTSTCGSGSRSSRRACCRRGSTSPTRTRPRSAGSSSTTTCARTSRRAIRRADVTAAAVDVEALLTAFIRATADISGISSGGNSLNNGGTSLALGFVIATNVVLSNALAEIDESNITTTRGGVRVHAENLSQIDAETLNSIESAGEGAGVTLAFNSIGWKSQNILFNLIDTILGDPLIANAFGNAEPAETTARIRNTRVDANGDVDVSAINEALIHAMSRTGPRRPSSSSPARRASPSASRSPAT